jgi:protein-S-isoprenylcysteine O-methyltransferase Ste14
MTLIGLLYLIILNVVLFFLFALIGSLDFRKKDKGKGERRVSTASLTVIIAEDFGFSQRLASLLTFVVEFYVAMHGFAVSIYGILWAFGAEPKGWIQSDYLLEITGIMLFFLGGLLVLFGWSKIYNAKDKLVADGVYKHVRHPQYLGILLATFGMIVFQFSPISLALWPVLVIIYYRLARKEEKNCEDKFGEEYRQYKRMVPMFIPFTFLRSTRE